MSEANKRAPRSAVDWDAIEPDWRAGIKTKKQMAEEYGVSRAAMDKHFNKVGVERDLTARIQAKAGLVRIEQDEFDRSGFVYVVYLDDSADQRFYKIGMASSFPARLGAHQCASPFDICVACAYFVGNMRQEERALHHIYAGQRVRGEWFRLSSDDLRAIAIRSLIDG